MAEPKSPSPSSHSNNCKGGGREEDSRDAGQYQAVTIAVPAPAAKLPVARSLHIVGNSISIDCSNEQASSINGGGRDKEVTIPMPAPAVKPPVARLVSSQQTTSTTLPPKSPSRNMLSSHKRKSAAAADADGPGPVKKTGSLGIHPVSFPSDGGSLLRSQLASAIRCHSYWPMHHQEAPVDTSINDNMNDSAGDLKLTLAPLGCGGQWVKAGDKEQEKEQAIAPKAMELPREMREMVRREVRRCLLELEQSGDMVVLDDIDRLRNESE